jgi:hypothetical protein
MDVNETLRRLRQLIVDQELADSSEESAKLGWEAAELFRALDEWLSKGGFLPDDWSARAVLARRQGGV